ncbi:MAG: hypothetical protein CUN49_18885, partial [Candidatus Thermofonsia Clade 1 bacterium]
MAQQQAVAAAPLFRGHNIWHAYVESLLAQAHAAIGMGDPRRAADFLKQADGLITERIWRGWRLNITGYVGALPSQKGR